MKSYYCKRLYEEINFDAENIYVCCGHSLGPSFEIYNKQKNLKKYIKTLLNWRKSITELAGMGNVSPECRNCIQLEVSDISFKNYILEKFKRKNLFQLKNIIIKSFRQCEFSCAYCLERKYTKGKKTTKVEKSNFYDFLPIFKEIIKNNMIDKNEVRLEFQGGSIAVWDEFKDTLKYAVDYGIKHFCFHTNALTYIPEISEVAANNDCSMSISIDSGCRETFKIIKGDDNFDIVINNITKYANAGINCSIKYILVENINDNLEELVKFCNTIDYIRSKVIDNRKIAVMLDIDFRKSLASRDYEIPSDYIRLFNYIIDFCSKNNIEFGTQEFIANLLKKSQHDEQ